MLPLTPARLPRSTTDRLLDGGTGPQPLRQLLAAAAAPAQAGELGGEQAARLAFTTSAGLRPLPGVSAHSSPRRTRALSWIVAAKAIAAVALAAGASGVAVAATSSHFPDGRPDVSTHQESTMDSSARPTVVVDRARNTTQQPDTDPAPESSPGPPDSARRGRTEPGQTPTRTAPTAPSDQPDASETDAVPDDSTPADPRTVASGNPEHTTGPANGNKKSTAKTPPGQQKEKENNGNSAGAKKNHSANSDHVSDPHSDTAEQQQDAGQE